MSTTTSSFLNKRPALAGNLFLALATTGAVLALVVLDEEKTFQWILARALGLSMCWLGYAGFRWVKDKSWWNEFFTWGVAGEAVITLIHRSFLGYIPIFWPLLLASGPVLSIVFAGGVREATKDQGWPENQAMAIALGGGITLHYVIVAGLVDAVFVLLTGHYP